MVFGKLKLLKDLISLIIFHVVGLVSTTGYFNFTFQDFRLGNVGQE